MATTGGLLTALMVAKTGKKVDLRVDGKLISFETGFYYVALARLELTL